MISGMAGSNIVSEKKTNYHEGSRYANKIGVAGGIHNKIPGYDGGLLDQIGSDHTANTVINTISIS
jgi:hypothetical protein